MKPISWMIRLQLLSLIFVYSCITSGYPTRLPNRKVLLFSSSFHVPRLQSVKNDDIVSEDNNNLESSYIRKYPRYRVDLTRSSVSPKSNNIWNQWKGAWDKASLLRRLQQRYSSSMSVSWFEGTTGVKALSTMWKIIAETCASSSPSCIVAFPDCDGQILQNFKEIVDWINEFMPKELVLTVTIMESQVMKIERKMNPRNIQHTDDRSLPDVVEKRTKSWVKRMLVDLAICPFTKSVTKSGQGLSDVGVPVGNISYHTSDANNIYQLLADTWEAINNMLEAGPSGRDGISSILLSVPFYDDDFSYWSGPIFTVIESCVVAAQAEALIGVVCFHPSYATPDGTSWPGFGHMHSVPRLEGWVTNTMATTATTSTPINYSREDLAAGGAWQRRTPHATINVLRADQLERAESRRNSPELYTRNIQLMMEIGNEKLHAALEQERRWFS
jgi:hypothetical protein